METLTMVNYATRFPACHPSVISRTAAPRNSLSTPDQSDKRKHEFHPFNTFICGYPGTAAWLGDGRGSNHRAEGGAIVRWKISRANSERSRGRAGRQNR